jgi:hypothetical protein
MRVDSLSTLRRRRLLRSDADAVSRLRTPSGASDLAKATEDPEGDPPIVVVAVDGHALVKHWNQVSAGDAAFTTQEGLGPLSTLAAFEQAASPASRGRTRHRQMRTARMCRARALAAGRVPRL